MSYSEQSADDYLSILGDDGQLVDVREPWEFEADSLPEAINLPLGDLSNRIDELDRSRRVVLLCRSGGRSANAAELLTGCGFADVVNLTGGMLMARSTSKGTRT